jgi:hypothetical protein
MLTFRSSLIIQQRITKEEDEVRMKLYYSCKYIIPFDIHFYSLKLFTRKISQARN